MAQSREKRNRRRREQPRTVVAPAATGGPDRRRTTRRVVLAFLVLIGLAGILAVGAPGDDPSGRPSGRATVG